MAKEYSGIHTVRSLIRLIYTALTGKVDKSSVTNNLTTADSTVPLAAAQGKVLDEKIKAIDTDGDGIVDNAEKLGGHPADYFAKATDVNTSIEGMKGEPGGLVPLDESGKVSSEFLPSYVDDVVEGMYDSTAGKFFNYENATKGDEIVGEKGKIYVDVVTNISYRWGGTVFVEITSADLEEISAAEVEEMWNNIAAGLPDEEGAGTEGTP